MPAQLSAVAARRAAQQANSHPLQKPPTSPNLQDDDQSTSQVAVSRKRKRRSRQAPTQESPLGTAVVNTLAASNHDGYSKLSAKNSGAIRTNSRQRDSDAIEVLPEGHLSSRIADDVQEIVLSSNDEASDDAADSPREEASPDHPDLELHLSNFQPSSDNVISSSRQDWTVRLGEQDVRISPRTSNCFLSPVARL